MSPYRLICDSADLDTVSGVCSSPSWVPDAEGFLPSLSVSDAFILGSAVVFAWSIGFGFKLVRKFLQR